MPIYEFQCANGHIFEEILGFNAPKTKKCPECSGRAKRLISQAAVHFKGSGWYVTDSKKSSKKAAVGSDKDVSAKHETEAKAESKPEKKIESKHEKKESKKK